MEVYRAIAQLNSGKLIPKQDNDNNNAQPIKKSDEVAKKFQELMKAANNPKGREDLLNFLKDNSEFVNTPFPNKFRPIHAFACNYELLVEFLSFREVDINSQNDDNQTALHLAVIGKKNKCIKILLEKKASVVVFDNLWRIPLHYGVQNITSEKTLRALIDVDPKTLLYRDSENKTLVSLLNSSRRSMNLELEYAGHLEQKKFGNIDENDPKDLLIYMVPEENFSLKMHSNWFNFEKEAPSDDVALTVSVIGDTNAGKSTLINSMTKSSIETGDDDVECPTSSNICLHFKNFDVGETNRPIVFLDLEGTNAKIPAKYDRWYQKIRSYIDRDTYSMFRKKAVSTKISRMSYLVSDVILFVSDGNLSRDEYSEKLKFLAAASENITVKHQPSLIIIFNKQDLKYCQESSEVATNYFLEVHDKQKQLSSTYRDIRVFKIPHWNHINRKKDLDGEKIYEEKIAEVNGYISTLLKTREREKKEEMLVYSTKVWFHLISYLIIHFDEKMWNLQDILNELLFPPCVLKLWDIKEVTFTNAAFWYFRKILTLNIHNSASLNFDTCRKMAISRLAYAWSVHLATAPDPKQFLRDINLVNSAKQKIQEEMDNLVKQMLTYAPCGEVSPIPDRKGNSIICELPLVSHSQHLHFSVKSHPLELNNWFEFWKYLLDLRFGWPGKYKYTETLPNLSQTGFGEVTDLFKIDQNEAALKISKNTAKMPVTSFWTYWGETYPFCHLCLRFQGAHKNVELQLKKCSQCKCHICSHCDPSEKEICSYCQTN